MTRTASVDSGPKFKGEDDELYRAILQRPKNGFIKKGNPDAEIDWQRKDSLQVEFEVPGHKDYAGDLMGMGLGVNSTTKEPSRLRQLLNALAEHDRDDDLWWDADSLEWGYDMSEGSAPEARLVPGMMVIFRGVNRANGDGKKSFRITGYKSAAKKS